MRRTTLGTMNIGNKSRIPAKEKRDEKSVGRSRSSFGVGGRLSNAGPRLSGIRPKTSFGSSREGSQYGRGDPHTQIKDSRPLSDKSYQNKEIKDILQFLSENDYQHAISMKTMMIPTSKEFLRVFSFLYSRISPDETYNTLMEKKPEEEVPKILKSLGYPFTIHKTSLSNVGSPHTWPILLGALHWLMELVRFAMSVNDDMEQCLFPVVHGEDHETAMNKVWFEYLEKTYEAFMRGVELENLGEYSDALREELRSQNAPIVAEVEQLSQENQILEEELESLQNEPSKLEALVAKKEALDVDKTKFEAYIADLQRHHVKLEEHQIQSEEALNTAKLEYEATSAEKMKLQQILANQELSAADVQRIRQKSEELKTTLCNLEEIRDSLDQEIWEKEMAHARRHEQVLAQCQDYNKRARKLKLIPSTAENAAGVDYELKYHLGKMSLDINNHLKPSLLRFKQQISECCYRCESELINLQEKHDLMQEQIFEKEEEIKLFEAKTAALEKEIQWKKQQYDEQQNKLSDEVDEMQNKIDQLRLENQSQVSEKREQLEEVKERLNKRKVEMDHERQQYEMFLSAACDLVIEHKTVIQERIQEVKKDMSEFSESIRSLPPVTSKLLTEDDVDRILAEDEENHPQKNVDSNVEPGSSKTQIPDDKLGEEMVECASNN